MITHRIISSDPFTVLFICSLTGMTAIEKYAVPLTKREIEAEYDYIEFPVSNSSYAYYAEIARDREKSGFGMN